MWYNGGNINTRKHLLSNFTPMFTSHHYDVIKYLSEITGHAIKVFIVIV